MTPQSIAVVIPALNEARALERNLPGITAAAGEVIVSDGGSEDGTREVAERLGARVIGGTLGRGPQLNRGAAASNANGLLFLHADTVLSDGAIESVEDALASGAVGGGFRVRFASPRPIYRLGSRIVNLRTRWFRSPLGDQAQFASRKSFENVGGYPDWPILEDLEFIRRLKRMGRIAILDPPVTTSARRFEDCGITRTIIFNWLIFGLYFAGASPERLARLYRDVR